MKEHIKQQGSVDMLSLKSFLVGPSNVGKTTTLRRLTGEIDHLSPDEIVPSTGIDKPLTVQLYRDTEQSSVLISEGWKSQGLSEQCQALCSYILKPPSSGSQSIAQQSTPGKSSIPDKQSTSVELSRSPSSIEPSSSLAPSTMEETTAIVDTVSSPSPFPSSKSTRSISTQPSQASPTTTTQDEIASMLDLLVKKKDWGKIQALLKLKNYTLMNVVDIGGQPEFHEMLPLLMHGFAISMLFLDMTKDLDSKYQVVYRDSCGSSSIQYESEYSPREVIQRALSSISSLQKAENYSKPAAILIGTHRDECSEADVHTLEQSVQKAFSAFIEDGVLCSVNKPCEEKRYVYPVNNVSEDFSDIEGLRELITTIVHDRFKPEPVPTATSMLHLILRMKYDPTPGWCSLDKCIEIAERCGISEKDLVKEGGILQYLHDRFGTILHYRGSKRVIVNPNIIMHPPAELFATAFGAKVSEYAIAENMRETGEIPHRLMKKVCTANDECGIIELLKSQHILYEHAKSDSNENFYFLPCLLCPDNNLGYQSQDPSHLSSLTYPPILLIPETGYVPLGPFPATVVKLSQSSHWILAESPRFRNRIRFYFQLPKQQTLVVELRALSTHLEFRIFHNASSKLINPRLIPNCLHELRMVFDEVLSFYLHTREMKWDYGFYCPHAIQSGQCSHPARCSTMDEPQDVICSQRDCGNGPVDVEDKHKCWFTVSYMFSHT